MGQLNLFKCQKCGFETSASPGGGDLLMDGGSYSHFMCPHCKSIVDLVFDPFKPKSEISDRPVCPRCGNEDIFPWDPSDGYCPECGGTLEDLGLLCLMD